MGDRKLDRWLSRYRDRRDVAALGRLFDATSADLLRLARHLCGDAAEAEDLVQATFLALLEHPERYDGRGSARAWMAGILTKEAQAFGRRAARRPDPERALEGPLAREEAARPERVASEAEGSGAVRAALCRLPEPYRGVLERNLLRDLEPAAIAAEVGRSAATVRVQLHRGLGQLRRLLPAGLAGGLVLSLGDRAGARGLGAVRAEVLAQAAALPLPAGAALGGAGVGTGSLLGALFMAKKTLLVGLVASLASLVWFLGEGSQPPREVWQGDGVVRLVAADGQGPDSSQGIDGARGSGEERSALAAGARSGEPWGLRPRLRVRTVFADGRPAPQVAFHYIHFAPGSELRTARSDDGGVAWLEALEPGSYALYGDRSGHGTAQVLAIEVEDPPADPSPEERRILEELLTSEVVLTLEAGHDIEGRVVDGDGRPVEGAVVWINTGMTRSSAIEVARSAADGSFSVRQVGGSCFVGARAQGHAPSPPHHVEHLVERARGAGSDPGSALELELVLPGAGARVRGTVRDPAGHPVAGARVRLGAQDFFDSFGPNGAEGPPPPLEVRTDEQGAYEGGGLAPGRVDVACLAPGFPARAASVEVGPGETGLLDLVLEDAGWVHGRVLDPAGRPVPGVHVQSWQHQAQVGGRRSSFDDPRAVSTADGGFRLGPLAPGEVTLQARAAGGAQRARGVLQVAAGRTYEWSLVLVDLPILRGRALDVDGTPLAGWTVTSRPMYPLGPPPRAVLTGADGDFEIPFPSTGPVRLELYEPERPGPDGHLRTWYVPRAPQSWLDDVPVPSEGLRLVLDPGQRPTARLVGELVEPLGLGLELAVATLTHADFGEVARVELVPGHGPFELTGLPAGVVELVLEAGSFAPLRRPGITLAQGETKDLGRLELLGAGALVLVIDDAAGRPLGAGPGELHLDLRAADGSLRSMRRSGNRFSAERLTPGTYSVEIEAEGRATLRAELEVLSGQTREERLTLRPGGPLGLVFVNPSGEPLGVPVHLRLSDGAGARVLERRVEGASLWLRAPFGALEVEAWTDDGRRGEQRVDFGPASGADRPVPILLR